MLLLIVQSLLVGIFVSLGARGLAVFFLAQAALGALVVVYHASSHLVGK